MAGNSLYTLYPAQFNGTLNLRQLASVQYSENRDLDEIVPAGGLVRGAVISRRAAPYYTIQTADLAAALGAGGLSPTAGLYCSAGALLQYQQREQGGTFATGSAHVKDTVYLGFLEPRSIICSGEGPAVMEMGLHVLWDGNGDHDPPVFSEAAQPLGGSSPLFNSQFYRAAATLGGAVIGGEVNVRIDFGLVVQKLAEGNAPYPTKLSVIGATPLIRIDVHAFALRASGGGIGNAVYGSQLSGPLVVYLAKGASGGTRAAAGNHLSITCSSGVWMTDGLEATAHADGMFSAVIYPTANLSIALNASLP